MSLNLTKQITMSNKHNEKKKKVSIDSTMQENV